MSFVFIRFDLPTRVMAWQHETGHGEKLDILHAN